MARSLPRPGLMVERVRVAVEGLVQGVGLRPHVHALATSLELRGFVRNEGGGVVIDIEGGGEAVDRFVRELVEEPPPLATIERVRVEAAVPAAFETFSIAPSVSARDVGRVISPDIATCAACVAELNEPTNRRYRHAFISCTRCGPRFTIVRGLPYDRARTTMAPFAMCAACRKEYENPSDRRFHAQTIACHDCGPALRFDLGGAGGSLDGRAAMAAAASALRDGAIVAVKGVGGYHLACDATDARAVGRLRARKHREAKPFAVMIADLNAAQSVCEVGESEARLLGSPERPIVLAEVRPGNGIAPDVAPRSRTLGLMLPYTPVHHLLLEGVARPLVMTSGNRRDEPICIDDAEAVQRLGGVADCFLVHDRSIAMRCDDSVVRVIRGAPAVVRRSRGFAPRPIRLAGRLSGHTLGVGGHLKNTFCLARERHAFVSHHVGDLETLDGVEALRDAVRHLEHRLDIRPRTIAHDLHPEYASTRLAVSLAEDRRDIRLVGVQHHHAHVAACAAEHGMSEPIIGVAFDGAGLGTDGAIWGGELLLVEGGKFDRLGHLAYVPLPGGDAAARHPWRSAVAHLWAARGGDVAGLAPGLAGKVDGGEWALVHQMLRRGVQTYPTSSVGRLFDAIAAIAGLSRSSRFEGEAAMVLEGAADSSTTDAYPVDVHEEGDMLIADPAPMVTEVARDVRQGRPLGAIASAFHNALRDLIVEWCVGARRRTGLTRVALTGGVFQNALLTSIAADALTRRGFEVMLHERVPCNDGGLSLGQVWASHAVNAH